MERDSSLDLESGRVVGSEALSRRQHGRETPPTKNVSPGGAPVSVNRASVPRSGREDGPRTVGRI
jgi:hypothetical protein